MPTTTIDTCTCISCRRERGENVEESERHTCAVCGEGYIYEGEAEECCTCCAPENGANDYPALQPLTDTYTVSVAAMLNRPVRRCSIEQEVVSGIYRAARLMEEIGLSVTDRVHEYNEDCFAGQVIVKEDGSLPDDGGEVVYSRFRLDSITDSENLSTGLARIRELKEQCLLTSGQSAGTHVHISARAETGETFQPQHMASLHEVFCHLEDTLYALAACGWDKHRMNVDGGYCKTLPKIKDSTPAKVISEMRADRYFGLNFQRLIKAVSQCGCGACFVGDWEACNCGAMDKATVEWRLFNSTTRPETVHAWLLIAHALTAYAAQHTLGTLEPTPIRSGTPDLRWAQLEWMLNLCPFTADERDIVRNAARRSPGFGERSDTY